jgi:hypothetical protein
MAFVDFTPLAFFKELHLLPRVIFTLGTGLLIAAFLVHSPALALGLLGVGLIFLGVAYNYLLNSFGMDPAPPYQTVISWMMLTQCLLSSIAAAAMLYLAFYTYRHGSLPTWLQPLPQENAKH